ncbi:TIGR01777 family oxidoreductase [Halpernia sp.]|uniref:TIGR01777 family oxidoreductase n=1 Tax=Halpernia sp. TaxID=2782209 RepID=UPI003A8DA717
MKILITGATGLVGKDLVKNLRARNHEVNILVRKKTGAENEFLWNQKKEEIDEKAFDGIDSIIHLAGASIGKRWTEDYKKELYSSRIDTAHFLFKTCKILNLKLKSYITASGINYYGTYTSDEILTEKDTVKNIDFLSELSMAWENSADEFSSISDKSVWIRTAMVLSEKGGSFPMLRKLVNYNLGSAVGSGKQWMNWIHLEDLINIYTLAVENKSISGKYNAVADEIPTNKDFMKSLAKSENKLFLPLNVPDFVLNLALGEMSEIILKGTRASNEKIKNTGFSFKYSNINQAFEDLI